VLVALAGTVTRFEIPAEPFLDLIAANVQDQRVAGFATWEELEAYCMLSAAPVGQLVLSILEAASPERVARSDHVCIGLQLVEHLQDVAEDARAGRIYLPLEDLALFGCPTEALSKPEALLEEEHRPALRDVVAYEVRRARALLADGAALSASLRFRPRLAVAAFGAGGEAALDAIERVSYDVVAHHCRPRPHRFAARWLATCLSKSSARS